MKLALHVIRKDTRHLWLPLTLWSVLLLLDALVVGLLLGQPASVRAYRLARVTGFLLRPLQTLLLVITIPLIVHDDPAVGTTAFWLTRPIPRMTMLAAKTVLVGVPFVVAPVLVEVAILRLHGIVRGDVGLAIPEVLVTWAWWAVTVAALAALTPHFARFALVGAVVTVTAVLLRVGEMVGNVYLDVGGPRGNEADFFALATSRSLAQSFAYIAVGSAVVTHQYVTRRIRRSVVVAVAGALLAFGVGTAWPWNFLPGGPPERTAMPPSGLTIDVAPSHVAEQSLAPGYASDSLQVFGRLELGGVPEDRAVDALVVRSDLTYPGHAAVTFDASRQDAAQAWLTHRWDPGLGQRVLGGVSFVNGERAPTPPLLLSVITRSAYQRHQGAEGTYRARLNVSVLRYKLDGAEPLTREAHRAQRSHMAILSVERERDAVVVLARETVLQLVLKGEPKWFGASMWSELGRRTVHVLRNPARREALWPTHRPFTDVDPLILLEIMSDRPLKQNVRRLVYETAVPISQEWLAGAELVRIDAHEVGTTTRDVVIAPFVLPPSLR